MSYESIIKSRLFRFLVGPQKGEFLLHAEAVAQLSPALNTLINGQMMEASEGCVIWEDTDEETFICCGQFAYARDYDAPDSRSLEEPHASDDEEEAALPFENASITSAESERPTWPVFECSLFNGCGRVGCSHCDNRSWKEGPPRVTRSEKQWTAFVERYYDASDRLLAPTTGELTWARGDYTHVFRLHAKMAVFADYHGISALETLALKKLTSLLASLSWNEDRVGDITQLITYVYDNTPQMHSLRGLRELVANYSACKVELLWKCPEFQNVMDTHPQFAKDVMGLMLGRLDIKEDLTEEK